MIWKPNDFEKKLPHHEMLFVAGGNFLMGSNDEEALEREKPVHRVELSNFFLSKYPVTQALWKVVMGNNPSYFIGDSRPVERVSWNEAQAFIQKINKEAGREYRLPTEAEWEYAARGGKYSKGYKYSGSNKLMEVGWYDDNSHSETKPVGLKYANELGLYDMNGNVDEWCHNWHNDYSSESQTNPQGPVKGKYHMNRGGSWPNFPQHCRPSYRNHRPTVNQRRTLGFRLAASLPIN